MNCGNCSREIRGERSSCLYCGWTKAEGLAAPTAARPVAGSEEPRTFRAGATTWRFLVWAVAATIVGVLLLKHPLQAASISGHLRSAGLATALLVLGPLAFAAQLLRANLVRVTVDPGSGLLLRSGRGVPWGEIESVDYAGFHRVSDQALIHFLLDLLRFLTPTRMVYGLWGALLMLVRMAFMAALLGLIVLVALLSGILLPVAILLSPWEPRVIVRTKNGPTLTWRDLRHEADFVHRVETGLRRVAGGDPRGSD